MKNLHTAFIMVLLAIIGVLAFKIYNDRENKNDDFYRVYIIDDHLEYIDGNTMKTIFKIILTSMLLINCDISQKKKNKVEAKANIEENNPIKSMRDSDPTQPDYRIYVEKIDSCEYIILNGNYGRAIIHKENCKNHNVKNK